MQEQIPSDVFAAPPPRQLSQRLLDLVFPPRCVGCSHPGEWFCLKCWPKMPWLPSGHCIHCLSPVTSGRLCAACLQASWVSAGVSPLDPYAVARHEGLARDAVHQLKYTPHNDIATVMGPVMAERLPDAMKPLVIPVPLHWTRKRQRGFNQSFLLARAVARSRKWPLDGKGLRRVRRTKDQIGLGHDERRANVAGAFRWDGPRIAQPVLLVDDVYTTGSTLNACADALRIAGARKIDAIIFASASLSRSSDPEES